MDPVRAFVAVDMSGEMREKLDNYRNEPLGIARIDAVHLIQSRLKPDGAEYTTLHNAMLLDSNSSC